MSKKTNAWRRAAIAVGLTAAVAAPAVAADKYVVHTLQAPMGLESGAIAMAETGWIVGWTTYDAARPRVRPVLWTRAGTYDLGTLGGSFGEARGVNNVGEVVGVSTLTDGMHRAFYWHGLDMHDLNVLAGVRAEADYLAGELPVRAIFEANAINDLGEIVACATFWSDDLVHGVRLVPVADPGRLELGPRNVPRYRCLDLGHLPDATECLPTDISTEGAVVGISGPDAFVWDGSIRALDQDTRRETFAAAVLEGRPFIAVGWSRDERGHRIATHWNHGEPLALETPSAWESGARDVSDRLIVGWAERRGRREAIIWYDVDEAVPLSALATMADEEIAVLEAVAVDGRDEIIGNGVTPDGRRRAFLAIPQPPR